MLSQFGHSKTVFEVDRYPHLGQQSSLITAIDLAQLMLPTARPASPQLAASCPNSPLLYHSNLTFHAVRRSISLSDFSSSPSKSPTSKPTARAPSNVAMQIMTKFTHSRGGGSSG